MVHLGDDLAVLNQDDSAHDEEDETEETDSSDNETNDLDDDEYEVEDE